MKHKILFCCPITELSQIKYTESNFFYFGNNYLKQSNIFSIDLEDKYENLALKMLLGYQKLKNLDFDFIFKYDCDSLINFDNIEKANLDISCNYGFVYNGHLFKKPCLNKAPLKIDTDFPLGGGYILNKETVILLSDKKYEVAVRKQIANNICTFEDVMVGKIIKDNNLKLINSGYWIDRSKWCYSSCYDIFYHSTNYVSEDVFKKIGLYLRRK